MRRGVLYVSYGTAAALAAQNSITSLIRYNSSTYPIVIVTDNPNLSEILGPACITPNVQILKRDQQGPTNLQRSRIAKLKLLRYAPEEWSSILYLDADTTVHGNLEGGFRVLEEGWDLALVPSTYQGLSTLQHIRAGERAYTVEQIGVPLPLQLQAGVMFIRRTSQTKLLFQTWQKEWMRYQEQDQAALLRALEKCPVRICLLGRDYNGGNLIEHHFGLAR